VIFQSKTLPEFWDQYNDLPEDIQRRAYQQFSLFVANPQHPSIQLKPVGEFWSARVTDACRALSIREEKYYVFRKTFRRADALSDCFGIRGGNKTPRSAAGFRTTSRAVDGVVKITFQDGSTTTLRTAAVQNGSNAPRLGDSCRR
jgi:hypothetical protein